MNITQRIANELNIQTQQASAAVTLLDEGASVPFIARYRKEATGVLDDTQLRQLEERLHYLRQLEQRRSTIIEQIQQQQKMTPTLQAAINAAETKTQLEDLYLPYKPKRRSKAQTAREAGLQPLADSLLENPDQNPEQRAMDFLNPEHNIQDSKAALEGAKFILMEQLSEAAELVGQLREGLWNEGFLHCRVIEENATQNNKFSDYFQHNEAICNIPSHRALAMFRGKKENILQLSLQWDSSDDPSLTAQHGTQQIAQFWRIAPKGHLASAWLHEVITWCWRIKLAPRLETELLGRLRERAESEAVTVFSKNLKDLLLSAPAGAQVTLGLDPGIRTGVKAAVIDNTGKLLDYATVFPHAPKHQWDASLTALAALCNKHHVRLVSIGNGTASRETDQLVQALIQHHCPKLTKAIVSEAGASVYSASALAAQEFPNLDVSYRGAVSIARRLQDPLAELVKIDPKAIGVGQYQHDVPQTQLTQSLDNVVEDCVNAVGVDVNMASVPLLVHIAGLHQTLAENIIQYRDQHGAFTHREQLKSVPRLGAKAFEQAAGFLRIMNGENPLDRSAVHPEAYPIVQRIATDHQRNLASLIGDSTLLQRIDPKTYADHQFGLPTILDILQELDKPARDPRPEFTTVSFKQGINTPADLKCDMILEGVVTNVTHFGAFVDIGVHQDGLVHISSLANHFVKDPNSFIKVGEIVRVKIITLDLNRNRIGLSMRLDETSQPEKTTKSAKKPQKSRPDNPKVPTNTLAQQFANARHRRK